MRTTVIAILFIFMYGCSRSISNNPGTIVYSRVITAPPASQPVTMTETVTLHQPQNPSSGASLKTDGIAAAIPGSYTPAGPAAPTPAAKAAGWLVWLGGILFVVGTVGVGLRFVPSIGGLFPIGVPAGLAGAGLFLIAYALWLDTAPWWVNGICIGAVIIVALVMALSDNWKKLLRSSS